MKKLIAIISVICIILVCAASCSSSVAEFSEEDQKTAENCAKKAAEKYYAEHFKGKTISGVRYSGCETSIKNSEFNDGKYIITVRIGASVSSGGYSTTAQLMLIKYSITVKNGTAKITDTDYIT